MTSRIKEILLFFVCIVVSDLGRGINGAQVCGRPRQGAGLIIGGKNAEKGAYPWVAVVKYGPDGLSGGGSLISYQHVLTVAALIHEKLAKSTLRPSDISILLGVYDLSLASETARVASNVRRIFVHPDWNPRSRNFDADIAILELERSVESSVDRHFVEPVCLWTFDQDLQEKVGIVNGIGITRTEPPLTVSSRIRELRVPIQSDEQCFLRSPALEKISSNRMFCAGSADGTGPCNGDSGSGLVVKHQNLFYIRGIVSVSLFDSKTSSCDLNSYVLYTDVLKFKTWISGIVGSAIDKPEDLKVTQATHAPITQPTLARQAPTKPAKTQTASSNSLAKSSACGVKKIAIGNIIGGSHLKRGEYPWMTSLLLVKDSGRPDYFCGGVVVSNTRIITAAHCIHGPGHKLLARDIIAVLGGYNLDDAYEIGRIVSPVKRLLVHPDWNPLSISFDADIALLELDIQVPFNSYIQPICLPDSSTASLPRSGIVAGYGKSEDASKKHENIPKSLKLNIVNNEECWLQKKELLDISSNRTLCAGTLKGAGSCVGDSGGGLYAEIDGRQHLVGIVSSSLTDSTHQCDVNTYSVFTNVMKYREFINSAI